MEPPGRQLSAGSPQATSIAKQRQSVQVQLETVQRQLVASRHIQPKSAEFLTPLMGSARSDCPPLSPNEVDTLVSTAAEEEALSPAILRAVMKQESSFKPCAVSVMGAQGLMQLMPETARELQVANPFDPRENVHGGAFLLRQLLVRFHGDLKMALGAYNAGATRVESLGEVPPFTETQNYVSSILSDLGEDSPEGNQESAGVQTSGSQPDRSPDQEADTHDSKNETNAVGVHESSLVLHLSLNGTETAPATVRISLPR